MEQTWPGLVWVQPSAVGLSLVLQQGDCIHELSQFVGPGERDGSGWRSSHLGAGPDGSGAGKGGPAGRRPEQVRPAGGRPGQVDAASRRPEQGDASGGPGPASPEQGGPAGLCSGPEQAGPLRPEQGGPAGGPRRPGQGRSAGVMPAEPVLRSSPVVDPAGDLLVPVPAHRTERRSASRRGVPGAPFPPLTPY